MRRKILRLYWEDDVEEERGGGKCAEDTGMHGYAVPAVKNLYIIKSENRKREGIYGV